MDVENQDGDHGSDRYISQWAPSWNAEAYALSWKMNGYLLNAKLMVTMVDEVTNSALMVTMVDEVTTLPPENLLIRWKVFAKDEENQANQL